MPSNNIIHKQIIDIYSHENVDGIVLQTTTEDFFKFRLQPKLEQVLDQYNRTDSHILIDELSVEVDTQSAEFDDYLLAQILSQVQTLLDSKITHTEKKQPPVVYADRLVQTLAFYLINGYMPWWAQVKDSSEWKKTLDELFSKPQAGVNRDILKQVVGNPVAMQRVHAELNPAQKWKLIEWVSDFSADEVERIKEDVVTTAEITSRSKDRKSLLCTVQNILMLSIATQNPRELVRLEIIKNLKQELRKVFVADYVLLKKAPLKSDLFQTVANNLLSSSNSGRGFKTGKIQLSENSRKAVSPIAEKNRDKEFGKSSKLNEGHAITDLQQVEIYIGNAGLCLIAPYLPGFFKNTGLIKEGKILNLNKAVSLLNFMVGRSATFADFEVVLPKIFCGAGLNTVAKNVRLNAADKKHCRELLTAVITNWEALKNTSVTGLQQSFLQRDGKLSRQQDNWLLTVEQKPYDMLLKQLPWNINMIRHMWMKEMVLVEWV